ncbi:helix-turn-helix transcriptional regulator [Myxococcaceae bacterium GXIMD 01537]
MHTKLAERVGTNVRAARRRAGLSQAQVAGALHVSELLYARLERGKLLPTMPTLVKLCSVLHVSLDLIVSAKLSEEAG